MTKKQTIIITTLSIVAFILAMMVSGRFWLRFDLTRNKAHTISQVSRNLHRELSDPVHITYYVSDRLRTFIPAPGDVEDTLREYAAHSRGRIRLSVSDPVREGRARVVEELGLVPRQVRNIERDQASLITVYSGIVIEYLDRVEVLPWVISTETLEYDLTSRIRSMINNTELSIGIIIGDSFRILGDFGFLHTTLTNAGYRVRIISPGEEIPDNLPGLFVFGGVEDLDEWALYRIDRYIQLGGRVMFAVKGIYVDIHDTLDARHQNDLGLLDMIVSYGVIVRPELALDRNALSMQFHVMSPMGGTQIRIARYPLWIAVLSENGNWEHPVSAGFSGLDLYWASPLELLPPPSVRAVPLVKSSPEAWVMRERFHTNPEIPYLLELDAIETMGTLILGASLTGVFPSFFEGSPKPVREDFPSPGREELPDMPNFAGESRIIVIGDTDFATSMITATQNITRGEVHNLDFLLRIADWLVNDDDIIGIRSRQAQPGRFDRISDPSRRVAAMRFSQIVNVGLIPLLVIVAGLTYASQRRKYAGNFAARARNMELKSAENAKETTNDV
jgi:ABC-type uncharacterized transport system involved in gliding motility auxiliary subunit